MPSSPRTREDPELRRAKILDEGIRVIGERGYYGFTVQDMAQRCGLSNGGLLHHFPSKDHLLLAVLAEIQTRETAIWAPLVEAAARGPRGESAKAAVRELLLTMLAHASADPQISRFLAELTLESLDPAHPAHEWGRAREAVILDLFVTLIGPYVDAPLSTARLLLSVIDGLALQWLRANHAFDILAEWDRALAKLAPELGAAAAR